MNEDILAEAFASDLFINLPSQEEIVSHILAIDSTTLPTIRKTIDFLKKTTLDLKKTVVAYVEERDLRDSPQELVSAYLDFLDYTGALYSLSEAVYRRLKKLEYEAFMSHKADQATRGNKIPVSNAMTIIDGNCAALKGISLILENQSRALWERIQAQKRLIGSSG
jgi:NADPH-dependent ferric siderophore reductase